ncbi:MAG TPA: hypothetical protein VN959_08815 [Mycobacterium sp.]|nr:hypothetical protein [Mycobacterium sp.]
MSKYCWTRKDPPHIIVVEHWDSRAHDQAYQDRRAGDGAPTDAITMTSP